MKFLIAVILIQLMSISCGRFTNVEPNEFNVETLNVPKEDDNNKNSFNIVENSKQKLEYESTILVWDSEATVKTMSKVINNTINRRNIGSNFVDFAYKNILSKSNLVSSLSNKKEKLITEKSKWLSDNTDNTDAMFQVGKSWFENRVKNLLVTGKISNIEKTYATNMFELYCDYKVWEFAVSALSLTEYSQRPTPLVLCENYYSKNNFFNSSICTNSLSPKNYFNCLWNDGVMKTKFYKSSLSGSCKNSEYPSKQLALADWVESGVMKKIVGFAYNNDPNVIDEKEYAESIISRIFKGKRFKKSSSRKFGIKCRDAFVNANGNEDSLKNISKIIVNTDSSEKYILLPQADRQKSKLSYSYIAEPVALISNSLGVNNSSINDFLFNSSTYIKQDENEKRLLEAKSHSYLKDFFAASPKWENEYKILKLSNQLKKITKNINDKLPQVESIADDFRRYTSDNINILMNPKVARVLLSYNFIMTYKGDHIEFKMDMSGEVVAKACYYINTNSNYSLCKQNLEENEVLMWVKYKKESGTFEFLLNLDAPELFGFKELKRKKFDLFYSDLMETEIINKTMILNMNFSTLKNNYNFYTGTFEIKDIQISTKNLNIKLNDKKSIIKGSVTGHNMSQTEQKIKLLK